MITVHLTARCLRVPALYSPLRTLPAKQANCRHLSLSTRASGIGRFPVLNDYEELSCDCPDNEDATILLDDFIGPGLQLIEQRLLISGHTLRLVMPEADISGLRRLNLSMGAEQNQVYWGRLWPAGLALAHYILQHPHTVRGREVCELGAGLGLAGLAAAVAGARQVTFTDREPLALQCALRSARACGLEQVQPLDTALRDGFQGEPAEDPAKSFLIRAKVLDFDFIPESREQHEVLLGADILYNFSDNAVQDALPKLLAPGGRFIHAEPDNHFSGAREGFDDMLSRIECSYIADFETSEWTVRPVRVSVLERSGLAIGYK